MRILFICVFSLFFPLYLTSVDINYRDRQEHIHPQGVIVDDKNSFYQILKADESIYFYESEIFLVMNKLTGCYNVYVISYTITLPNPLRADDLVENYIPVPLRVARAMFPKMDLKRKNYGFKPL